MRTPRGRGESGGKGDERINLLRCWQDGGAIQQLGGPLMALSFNEYTLFYALFRLPPLGHVARRTFHSRSLPPRLANPFHITSEIAPPELRPWKQVTLYETRLPPWGALAMQRRTRHFDSRLRCSSPRRNLELIPQILCTIYNKARISPFRTLSEIIVNVLLWASANAVNIINFSIWKIHAQNISNVRTILNINLLFWHHGARAVRLPPDWRSISRIHRIDAFIWCVPRLFIPRI